MGIAKFPDPKDPGDDTDFTLNWDDVLPVGDTISASTWVVPTGLTQGVDSFATRTTTVWLSGGTAGMNYTLVNTVVTAAGRTFQRDVLLKVKNL